MCCGSVWEFCEPHTRLKMEDAGCSGTPVVLATQGPEARGSLVPRSSEAAWKTW
jgi:hypothetical protein